MSRGLGRLQRAVLKLLEENRHFDTREIAELAHAVEPDENGVCVVTDAQYVSVRRALAALARQGMAMRTFRGPDGRQRWANLRFTLDYRARVEAAFGRFAHGEIDNLEFEERRRVLGE